MSACLHAPASVARRAPAAVAARPSVSCCPVVELRHYTLRPGTRDRFVALFDRELAEPQEAAGMHLLGQFRDMDRPDTFTWLRGFPDMAARRESLAAFYGGPVWAAHRDAANGMLLDSDDVRLLRPVRPDTGLTLFARPATAAITARPRGLLAATILTLRDVAAAGFPAFFERVMMPRLHAAGLRPIAAFETEPARNTYPRLPVREAERAFVWLTRHPDGAAHERAERALAQDPAWREEVAPALDRLLRAPAEVWRLAPTPRSAMPR